MTALLMCALLLIAPTTLGDRADYSGSGPAVAPIGSTVLLQCRVSAFASIKWYLNDSALSLSETTTQDPHYTLHVTERVAGTSTPHIVTQLTVTDVQPEHAGLYRCTTFVHNSFHLQVYDRAGDISVSGGDSNGVVILTRTNLVLDCNTTRDEAISTKWYRSKWSSSSSVSSELLVTSDRLTVSGSRVLVDSPRHEDAGNYTCSVLTTDGLTHNRTVQVVTNVTVRVTGRSVSVVAGDNLTLDCFVYGAPRPTAVWFKDNISVTDLAQDEIKGVGEDDDGDSPSRRWQQQLLSASDGSWQLQLSVQQLQLVGDRGRYCCRATGSWAAGQLLSSDADCVLVRVQDPYAVVWPCVGIAAELVILCTIIFVSERSKNAVQRSSSNCDGGSNKRK